MEVVSHKKQQLTPPSHPSLQPGKDATSGIVKNASSCQNGCTRTSQPTASKRAFPASAGDAPQELSMLSTLPLSLPEQLHRDGAKAS